MLTARPHMPPMSPLCPSTTTNTFLQGLQYNNIIHSMHVEFLSLSLLRIEVERLMTSVIALVITVDWLHCEANCHTLLGGG